MTSRIIPRMFTVCLDAMNQGCALEGAVSFHGDAVSKINPHKLHSQMIFFTEQPMLVLYHLYCLTTPTVYCFEVRRFWFHWAHIVIGS